MVKFLRHFVHVQWAEPYVWANVIRLQHGNLWWTLQVRRLEVHWKRIGSPYRFL